MTLGFWLLGSLLSFLSILIQNRFENFHKLYFEKVPVGVNILLSLTMSWITFIGILFKIVVFFVDYKGKEVNGIK